MTVRCDDQDMTEETQSTDAEIDEYWRERERDQPDLILASLVQHVEENLEDRLPVTLNVSGLLVTGLLATRLAWLDASKAMDVDWYGESLRQRWTEEPVSAVEDGDGTPAYHTMIHLVEARYLVGLTPVPQQGGFPWRGRLSRVDGWSPGTLGTPHS